MNATPESPSAVTIRPPKLVQSLVGGFNTVANHVYLILLPVALDLLLWFGPHLRIKTLMEPQVRDLLGLMRQTSSTEMRPVLENMQQLWMLFLEQYNLLTTLSTFPIGVPTLMSSQLPMRTPLGPPGIYEIYSLGQFLLGWLSLTLLGYILGTLYFSGLAQCCAKQVGLSGPDTGCDGEHIPQPAAEGQDVFSRLNLRGNRLPPFRPSTLAWQFVQVIGLVIAMLIILLVLMVPSLLLASLLALVSPFLAQMALLLVSFSAVWFLVPLIFSPHGIFLCGQSVINAMLNSARVVRHILPGTGIFLLAAIILNQGMGVLWRIPPESSWMALVGVFGHAVITTGLLAASFIYYRGGLTYVQSLRKLSYKPM